MAEKFQDRKINRKGIEEDHWTSSLHLLNCSASALRPISVVDWRLRDMSRVLNHDNEITPIWHDHQCDFHSIHESDFWDLSIVFFESGHRA